MKADEFLLIIRYRAFLMQKEDLGYSFAIGLVVGLFLLPILINNDQYSKLSAPQLFMSLFVGLPVIFTIGLAVAGFISKKIPLLWQFAKFALVGVLNTAIDFGILNLLMFVTKIESGLGIIPLNTISFSTAVINSFFWNKKWVFKKEKGVNFITFFTVTLIGLVINNLIVYLITTYVPPVFDINGKLWANLAKALATGVAMIWNFTGYRLIVFKK